METCIRYITSLACGVRVSSAVILRTHVVVSQHKHFITFISHIHTDTHKPTAQHSSPLTVLFRSIEPLKVPDSVLRVLVHLLQGSSFLSSASSKWTYSCIFHLVKLACEASHHIAHTLTHPAGEHAIYKPKN